MLNFWKNFILKATLLIYLHPTVKSKIESDIYFV